MMVELVKLYANAKVKLEHHSNPCDPCGQHRATIEMDAPQTPEEEALYVQFRADLWKMRARAQGMLSAPYSTMPVKLESPSSSQIPATPQAKLEPLSSASLLTARPTADGGFSFSPRSIAEPVDATGHVKAPPDATAPKDDDETSEADLDPYAGAALAALANNRLKAKATSKTTKRKQCGGRVKAEPPIKKAVGKPPKRGIALKPSKAEPKSLKAEPKPVKAEPVEVATKEIIRAMPKDSVPNPNPVLYNGGIVYTVPKKHKFRALKVRGDRYTEKSSTWGANKSKQQAWKDCIKAIDEARKSGM